MLGWYDRRLIRPLWVNLPKDGTVFSLSDGFIHHPGAGKALDELARRDGFRIEVWAIAGCTTSGWWGRPYRSSTCPRPGERWTMPDPLAILFGVAAAWSVGRWISNRRRPPAAASATPSAVVSPVDWAAMAEREPRGCPCRECGRGWWSRSIGTTGNVPSVVPPSS